MITHDTEGQLFFPDKYCEVNKIGPITDKDCFHPLKGNTASIENYFKDNFDNFNFEPKINNFNVWTSHDLDVNSVNKIIDENETLRSINKILKISHCFIMKVNINSWVAWHYDYPKKGPVINLVLTTKGKSHSLFTYNIPDTSNLIECNYQPHQFCLYNTELLHSILNFEEPRYLFSVIFERGQQDDLNWEKAKTILADYLL